MQFCPITRRTRSYVGKMGPFKGIDAIRPVFDKFVAEFQKPGGTSNTKQWLVEGDYAYMVLAGK